MNNLNIHTAHDAMSALGDALDELDGQKAMMIRATIEDWMMIESERDCYVKICSCVIDVIERTDFYDH